MVALWCVGSVAGGLVYGAGRRTIHPLVLVLALSVCTLPAAFVTEPWQLAIAVVVAGLPCAPALSAINASLVSMVPERRRGEVMGWSGTANTVGAALGAPVCGWVIDHHGASAGFATAAAVGITLSAGGLLVLRLGRSRAAASADRAGELLAGAVAGGVREG
ncbi:MFS transporter [Cellulomonas hominis]